jgi:hypothetical protein
MLSKSPAYLLPCQFPRASPPKLGARSTDLSGSASLESLNSSLPGHRLPVSDLFHSSFCLCLDHIFFQHSKPIIQLLAYCLTAHVIPGSCLQPLAGDETEISACQFWYMICLGLLKSFVTRQSELYCALIGGITASVDIVQLLVRKVLLRMLTCCWDSSVVVF